MWAGGRADGALAAFLAAMASGAVLVCAASLTSFLIAWLMRSRRRGELFTLVFVLGFTVVSFLPMFASRSREGEDEQQSGEEKPFVVQEFDRRLPVWVRYLPSEIHGRTIMAGLTGTRTEVATGIGLLLAQAALLFVASARVHRRMLNSLEGDSGRRRSADIRTPIRKVPFLSPAASAVAWAMYRGALRTVRGRLTILLPGPMLAMLTFAFRNVPQETWARSAAEQGYLLLAVSIVFTLYSLHAVSMNLFGSDRAGLTMQLLVPLSNRELAWGKVAGFAMIILTGLVICLSASLAVARSGPPAYWIATLLGGAAAFILICPVALWMSALFPVASDLSKTGGGGNPHPVPMIVGTLCTVLFAAPAAIIIFDGRAALPIGGGRRAADGRLAGHRIGRRHSARERRRENHRIEARESGVSGAGTIARVPCLSIRRTCTPSRAPSGRTAGGGDWVRSSGGATRRARPPCAWTAWSGSPRPR